MIYDLIVIGGGPAGLLAAGRAGEKGAKVLLLEKNDRLGIKLLITGKGRCNLTNAEFDLKKFVSHYGPHGKFLFSSVHKFGPAEVINFFNQLGVMTKIERGQRVFPKNDTARAILQALMTYVSRGRVEIRFKHEVKQLYCIDNKITKLILANGQELIASNYLIATGGKSYPATGSSGQAYDWLKKMGHNIIVPEPALVPINVKEIFVKELEGLSLKNVSISIFQKNKKIASRFGEALFTAHGLSGPIILDLSKIIGQVLKHDIVELAIDFKPVLDFKQLDLRIQKDFFKFKSKLFRNSLKALLPQKLIPVLIKLSGISPEKKVSEISKVQRIKLVHLIKNFRFIVSGIAGFEQAIITSGGVDLKEVDPRTMRSKIIENLYLAGEILNLDGPTGGFNLQICWSTGYTAGDNFNKGF